MNLANEEVANNLADYDQRTVELIDAAEREVAEAEMNWTIAAEQAKELKKTLEASQSELRALIRDRRESRGKKPELNLFTGADQETPAGQSENPESESWKEFPLARWVKYGLTESDVKKLAGCVVKRTGEAFPIRTVGDLNRFVQPNISMPEFSRGFADVKGFGLAAADRLSDAEAKFWEDWNNGLQEQFEKEQMP